MAGDVEAQLQEIAALETRLYQSRGTSELSAMKEYATIRYEEVKEQLVSAAPASVEALQGKAAAYMEIINVFEIAPADEGNNSD